MGGLPIVGDVWNEISGANTTAEAAQNSARAQQRTARSQQQTAMDLAEATPEELRAFEQTLSAAEKNLQRREKMISAIDPALMEASEQVLSLLRGEEAGATEVANEQRNRQRQQLVDSLRAQYGPGAESTSVGQRALQEFDAQTNMLTQQNQQNALNQVFGIAGSAGQIADSSQALAGLSQAGRNFGNIQNRQVQAFGATSGGVTQTAGAEFTGDLIRGQSMQNLTNQAVNTGALIATGGLSGMGNLFGGGGGGEFASQTAGDFAGLSNSVFGGS